MQEEGHEDASDQTPSALTFTAPEALLHITFTVPDDALLQIGVEDPVSDATLLTAITAPALRGDVQLQLANTSVLRRGQ